MAAEEAEQPPEVEEFSNKANVLGWAMWFASVVLLVWGAVAEYRRSEPGGAAVFLVFAAVFLATAACYTMRTRGQVRLDRVGITARNWRGQKTSLPWAEVARVCFVSRILCLPRKYKRLEVHSFGRKLTLAWDWPQVEELGHAIVTRAGLTQRTEYDWGTTYTRPEAEPESE